MSFCVPLHERYFPFFPERIFTVFFHPKRVFFPNISPSEAVVYSERDQVRPKLSNDDCAVRTIRPCHLSSVVDVDQDCSHSLLIHSCELSHFKMLYFDNCWETSVHLLILERNESRQGLPAEYSQFLPSVFHHAVVMLQTSQRTLVSIKHGLCLNGSWVYFPDGNSIHKWLHTFYLSLLKEAVMSNWNDKIWN